MATGNSGNIPAHNRFISNAYSRCPKCLTSEIVAQSIVGGTGKWKRMCGKCGHQYFFATGMIVSPAAIALSDGGEEQKRNTSNVPPKLSTEDPEVTEALEQCERIFEKCEEMPDRGYEFADSVREKVESMESTIEKSGYVTPGQKEALDNMESGLDRWLDR